MIFVETNLTDRTEEKTTKAEDRSRFVSCFRLLLKRIIFNYLFFEENQILIELS